MAFFYILEDLLHFLQLLSIDRLPHTLTIHRNHLEITLVQDLIIQLPDEILVLRNIDAILPNHLLYLLVNPHRPVQQQILNNLINLGVDLGHSMIKCLLNILDIFLEQLGQNRKIPIPKPYLIDIGILLAQDSHYIIDIGKYKLIFVLTHQWLLLERTIQVVST